MQWLFDREPAVTLGVAQALIALAIGFGAHITPQQFGLILAALAAVLGFLVRSKVTPTAGQRSGSPGLRVLVFGLVLTSLVLGPVAVVRAESLLDPARFSAGPRAVVQIYDFDDGRARETGFVLGGAAAWNLTSRWDLDGAVEKKLNAGETIPAHWRYSAGAHVLLPFSSDRQQWFLAAERAWYVNAGETSTSNWVVRLQWSFGAQDKSGRDWAFAVVRARYDLPENGDATSGRKDFGFGIQPQLVGGH